MLTAILTASLLAASPALPCPEQARYFFILYGGQASPFRPRTAHTWATFVKVTPTVAGAVSVEAHTISWLPADGDVEVFRIRSVPGRNFSLDETFALSHAENVRMSCWGPYEIDALRYDRAVRQVARLESGQVRYRVFDSFGRNHRICHCVHGVTYADPVLQDLRQPVLQVGERGTGRLAKKYDRAGAFLNTSPGFDWLLPMLGIDAAGVVHRELGERIPRGPR
jgi:hypothetical protein